MRNARLRHIQHQPTLACFIRHPLDGGKHNRVMRHNQLCAQCFRLVNRLLCQVKRNDDARYLRILPAKQETGVIPFLRQLVRRDLIHHVQNIGHSASFHTNRLRNDR